MTTSVKQRYLNVIDLFSNDGYISTSKFLIRKIGLLEAVLMGELCSEYKYWYTVEQNFDGWFKSTIKNIEENTGINRKHQETAVKNLVNFGIIETKKCGVPPTRNFKINVENLWNLFNDENTIKDQVSSKESKMDELNWPGEIKAKNNQNDSYYEKHQVASKTSKMDHLNLPGEIDKTPGSVQNVQNGPFESSKMDHLNRPKWTISKDSNNNINNNINNNNNRTYKNNIALSIPTLKDVENYAKGFGKNLFIEPEDFYVYNSQREWKDDKGNQIQNWKALFNNWNNKSKLGYQKQIEKEKEIKKREQRRLDFLAQQVKVTCPNCKNNFSISEANFSADSGIVHCENCHGGWKVA